VQTLADGVIEEVDGFIRGEGLAEVAVFSRRCGGLTARTFEIPITLHGKSVARACGTI
jgi:hypothetical protein